MPAHGGDPVRDDRVLRVLRPSLVLVALAALLVVLGLAITGPAHAASATPSPRAYKTAKAEKHKHKTASPVATPAPATAPAVQRGAEVRAGEDVVIPKGITVPSVVALGGDVTVDGHVEDAVVAVGGNVTVNGSVGQSLVAIGGDVVVNGSVGAATVAFGGDVKLGRTADVGSDMAAKDASVVVAGGKLTRAPGAQVHGLIKRSAQGVDLGGFAGQGARAVLLGRFLGGFSFFGWLLQTLFCLVLALVAAALMPAQMRGLQKQLARRPWASLGWGALTFFIIGPLVLLVLVVTIIGLLLVLPYALFVLLAYFFAVTSVGAFVAQKVLTRFGRGDSLMLAVTLGVVGTTIVSRIPGVGPLALIVMMVMGTGAAVLGVAQYRRQRREVAAAQAAANAALAAAGVPYPESATVGQPAAVITPIVQTSPAQQAAGPAWAGQTSQPPAAPVAQPTTPAPQPPVAPEPPAPPTGTDAPEEVGRGPATPPS
jgi:hypothetical protein